MVNTAHFQKETASMWGTLRPSSQGGHGRRAIPIDPRRLADIRSIFERRSCSPAPPRRWIDRRSCCASIGAIKAAGRMYPARSVGKASERSGALLFLLAEVEYRAKSAEDKLRHPFFKGIREGRMDWSEALIWGKVLVAVTLGLLASPYFLIQKF